LGWGEDRVDLLLDLCLRKPLAVGGLQDRANLFALVFGQVEICKRPERGARRAVRLRCTAEKPSALNSIAHERVVLPGCEWAPRLTMIAGASFGMAIDAWPGLGSFLRKRDLRKSNIGRWILGSF